MEGLTMVPSTRKLNNTKEPSTASTTEVETLKNDINDILSSNSNDIDKLNAARERMKEFYKK
jgi:peptidoglycan hydrolase CwlO-like protein